MTADELNAMRTRASALAKAITRGLPTGTKEDLERFLHDLVDRIDALEHVADQRLR